MSIFSEALASYQNETSTIKNPKQWFLNALGGKSKAGVTVNERKALTISAYYDGVNLISNHIGYLPFNVILRNEDGNRTKQPGHNVRQLMEWEANTSKYGGMSAFTFKKTMTIHMLNWGNAFAIIHKNGREIDELELIEPWNANIYTNKETKELFYSFSDYERYFLPSEVLHLHQFSLDGIKGKSIIEAGARDRMGGHIAVEQYAETFFGNSTHMGGLLTTEDSLGTDPDVVNEAKSEVRQELDNVYGDPEDGWHRIGILDGKWQYKDMTLPAEDAQLIQRSEATVPDVARWLGIPPSKLKSPQNQAYNTREHEAIDYVQDGLMPRTKIWEQETRRKLITSREKREGYETSINTKDLMRGDLDSMADFLTSMVDRGIFTQNQALEFMGEDTFPEGDVHLMPANYTTLEAFLENQSAGMTEEQAAQALKEISNNKNGHHETDTV